MPWTPHSAHSGRGVAQLAVHGVRTLLVTHRIPLRTRKASLHVGKRTGIHQPGSSGESALTRVIESTLTGREHTHELNRECPRLHSLPLTVCSGIGDEVTQVTPFTGPRLVTGPVWYVVLRSAIHNSRRLAAPNSRAREGSQP